ncbi:ankyrin repeat protein [Ancylostoma ceylanicum]|uniref:Ankyrin repeat protein n=1 Tax=Ancylostoma ceylanicum TaxID=53326 RepID=A0A0D6LYV6_9BILA|nr:ankyrin repeat protein [Ancylostoma ceylanicum]
MHSLKQAGGDLMAVDRDRLGVIHCAASHGYHEDHRLRTPSHCAAAKGQMRMLKLLKQYNASFEIQNYRGDLPVHEAVQTGSKDVVEWLLALQPSSINAASHEGRTCLHLAAAQGNLEMVILLCTKGCFVNPLMLYKVVVDYLSTKHEAKCAEEIPEEEREKNRMSFEEQLVQAKLARGRHLHDEDEENEAMMKKSKAKRRRSSETLEHRQDVTSTGVNTSERRVSSAGSPGATLPKSTSTSDLINAAKMKSKADERIEQIIREEIQKVAMTKLEVIFCANSLHVLNKQTFACFFVDLSLRHLQMSKKASNGDNENKAKTSTDHSSERSNGKDGHDIYDYPDIDDEFEDLPAISDTSDEDYDDDGDQNRQSGSEDDDDEEKRKENLSHSQSSILKRNQSKERSNANHHHTLIRVHRMSEGGENAGDFEVFEDDWEEIGANRATGKDASRRYIHEKAIFQELTHLKRMQIQYGKV